MASSPMRRLCSAGRYSLYWAAPSMRFTKPGVVLWTGKRHVRLLPLPQRRQPGW